jgi:hypothetical protein
MPKHGLWIPVTTTVPTSPTTYTVHLRDYAVVRSAGTVSGLVQVSVPGGLQLTNLTASPVTESPDGSTPLVGAVSYEVAGLALGASVDVTVMLPRGSNPTTVYKEQAGTEADMASHASISGDTLVLHLKDGGYGDEDGVANGVIVDPIVPRRVDHSVPTVSITDGPAAFVRRTSAVIGFVGVDGADDPSTLEFTCKLDSTVATACTSPFEYSGLEAGEHQFRVTVRDAAGNSSSADYTWQVDRTPPMAWIDNPLHPYSLHSNLTATWEAIDNQAGLDSVDVRVARAHYNSDFNAWTYPTNLQNTLLKRATLTTRPGNTYCFSLRARDRIGNLSHWSRPQCTATATDDRKFTASAGWTRVIGDAYYGGTAIRTSTRSTTLTSLGVQTRSIYLIATRCTRCGTVGVFWNGIRLGHVNLYATSTIERSVTHIATFKRPRTGNLTLRTTRNGRRVQIDGVAFLR